MKFRRNKKNLILYFQAWKLKKQGKKLKEIAKIMGYKSIEWPRHMIFYIDFLIKNKPWRLNNKIKKLINKVT
jgi:hypothetical protein